MAWVPRGDVLGWTEVEREAAAESPPNIFWVAPCCLEPITDALFICLATNVLLDDLTIDWEPWVATPPVDFPSTRLPTGKYVTGRVLKVTQGGPTPGCHVQHKASNVDVRKPWPKDVCAPAQQPAPQPPLVALVEPKCDGGGSELELLCVFWSSEVEKVKATWLLNGREMHLPTAKKVEHGRSGLKVKRDSWDKGDVYTCQVTQPLGGAVVMRNTSKCLVCFAASLPPQLYITQPSYADVLTGSAEVSCLLLGWHLQGATLSFNGNRLGTTNLISHPNGTQTLLFTRHVSLRQWLDGGQLRCEATVPCHSQIVRELPMGPEGNFWKEPKATVTRVPPGDSGGGLLLCSVTGFAPRDIIIHWEGGWGLQARAEMGPITGRGVFSSLSVLHLEKGEEGKGYVCVVRHPVLEKPLRVTENTSSPTASPTPETQQKSSSPRVCPRSPPSSLQPPSFHELFLRRAANLTCSTTLANATMGWTAAGRPADPQAVKTQAGGATGTRSWLRVSLKDWIETANFSCRVRGGAEETQLELSRRTGPLKPPSVHVLPSSPAEACAGRDFTLFCLVKDFYPPEIAVWWRQGPNEGPANEEAACDHQAQRCSLVATVEVPWGEWVGGTSYACLAAHISTGELAKKSVDAQADPWGCAGLPVVPCGLVGDGDDLEPEEDSSAWTTIPTFVVLFLLLVFYSGFVTFIKVK